MKRLVFSVMFVLMCHCLGVVVGKNASEWRSRTIYQLLTDRFASSNVSSIRCQSNPMTRAESRIYCGGTYRGATDQLDYISEMGFDAIWISPIPSNVDNETVYGVGWHGYWQDHLDQLNRHFGNEEDLLSFIAEAHRRDIWILLDVVVNHVGPNCTGDYVPFILEEHYHQPMCSIRDYNNQTEVEFCSLGDERSLLPDLNTENEFVISTFINWINDTVRKYQFDGIRIDTFRHVRKSFWKDYIDAAGVYSLGEVASSNSSYAGSYQKVADGILHYPLYFVLNVTFTDDDRSRQSMRLLEKQVNDNERDFIDTTLCGTFLDNHDQDRFLNHTQNRQRIENALVYLLFSDGIPIVYMGTEQNFTGNPNEENGANDPWNRQALWTSNYDRDHWIYHYLSQLNRIRSMIKRTLGEQFFSSHQQTMFIDDQTYVYRKGSLLIIVSNEPFNQTKFIRFPSNIATSSSMWTDLLSNRTVTLDEHNRMEIRHWSPQLLLPFDVVSSSTLLSTSVVLTLAVVVVLLIQTTGDI